MNPEPWQFELVRPAMLWALAALVLLLGAWRCSLVRASVSGQAAMAACRAAVVGLVVFSLAAPLIVSAVRRPCVLFALDRSRSVSAAGGEAARRFCEEAIDAAGAPRAVFVPFAAEVGEPREDFVESPPDIPVDGTDLESPIEAAGPAFAPDRPRRLVLLSDGLATQGDAPAAAACAGFPVLTVPLASRSDPEVFAARIGPARRLVRPLEPFEVEVLVHASRQGQGTVELLRDGQPVALEEAAVRAGGNRFLFDQTLAPEQSARLTARLTGFEDTIAENNETSCVILPGPRRRVLLVEGRAGAAGPLAESLRKAEMAVEVRSPEAFAASKAGFESLDLLVLVNVPGPALGPKRIAAVRDYVTEGGGLLVIGGDRSLTVGDYRGTPLEAVLPVACAARRERRRPQLALVLLIDRSTSMAGTPIELAKQATRRAVTMLQPTDKIGVLAFDESATWISPIRPCGEKREILGSIAEIEAGGRTDTYVALERAYLALDEAFAERKHMILLTDGISHPGDFDGLARQFADAGITLSTVAVGKEAAGPLLEGLAEIGRGRYYYCDDPAAVPKVFARETASAGRPGVVEEPSFAKTQPMQDSPIHAETLDLTGAPALLGYVETQPKPAAEVLAATEHGDPLLATMRCGRGTSTVFTSDAEDRWAAAWLDWQGFSDFWVQVARRTLRQDETWRFHLRIVEEGPSATILLDAVDEQGRFIDGAEATFQVTPPKGEPVTILGEQGAPGRYAARLDLDARGEWLVAATLGHEGRDVFRGRRALVTGYPDELRTRRPDRALLERLAEVSGGAFDPRASDVFAPCDAAVVRRRPLWSWLLGAAAMMLVLDAAVRRWARKSRP